MITRDRQTETDDSGAVPFLLGSVLLGTIGVFVHYSRADPMTITWFRCAFGLLGLSVWLWWRGGLKRLWLNAATSPGVVTASVLMVVSWGLFFFAIARTSTGVAVVLFHMQPLWVLVLGAAWLGEPIGRRRIMAVSAAMFGLVFATGVVEHTALFGEAAAVNEGYWLGIAACLIGAFFTACVTILAKRLGGMGQGVLAWWQCAIGAVVLVVWPLHQGWPAWGSSWAWLSGLGLIHTGLAYGLIYDGTARLPAGRIAVLQFAYPAIAILLDWLFFGERLSVFQLGGIAVMSVAILFAERRQ